MNNQEKVSVTAVPFNPQTQSFTPTQPTPAIAPAAPTIPNMPTPTPSPTITADNLGVQKINVPAAPVAQTVAIPVNQADQILKDTAVAETEAQKASTDLSKSILSLIPNLQGQTQELATQQRVVGLPALKQNLQNINNQILQKQAELNQDDIKLVQSVQNIEDKPIAMEFITGQQQSVQRNAQIARALKASEIGVLNATALGMQGNISLAEATAKQAVETKYAPYKEALETYKLQLEALTPLLNSDEKKQAREQEIKTKLAFNDIERRQKNEETSNKMVIDAMAFAPQNVTAAAQKVIADGGTPVQVAQALGKYAGDFLGNQLKLSSIAENNAQIAKIAADIKATQATIPNNGVPGTSSYLYTTLANSAVNKESLDATERQSVAKNLSVIDQLGSLQSNIAKQNSTGFIKGNVNNLLASIGQNADVGTINAQLQAIVPNLARGVYGEVGVLTDNDIANYRATLPTLTSPKQQNDAVLALTLKAVQNNLKNTLLTSANSKKDVSRFIPQYNEVTMKINSINDSIGVSDVKVGEIVKANPQVKPLVEAMIKEGRKGSEILQVLGAD